MDTIYSNALKRASTIIKSLSVKEDNEVNIKSWQVEMIANDKVTPKVTIKATIDKVDHSVVVENWQPSRIIEGKSAWKDSKGGRGQVSEILDAYANGTFSMPNQPKECLALIGYWLTLNLLGKPISAASGGRAVLVSEMLKILKPTTMEIVIDSIGSGGSGNDYTLKLSLPQISKFVEGGRFRGDMVLALNEAKGKRANTQGSAFQKASMTDIWE